MSSINNIEYYNYENILVFPTANSKNSGKLTIEDHMRDIVTRITELNYKLDSESFKLTLSNNKVVVSAGKANIAGYGITTTTSITMCNPTQTGNIELALVLHYDESDHLVGNNPIPEDSIEYYEGVRLEWLTNSSTSDPNKRLLLGSVMWDGSNYSQLINYDSDNMIRILAKYVGIDPKAEYYDFSTKNISLTNNLQVLINNLNKTYVSKFGELMDDGSGGDMYKPLYFRSNRKYAYRLKLGLNDVGGSYTLHKYVNPSNEPNPNIGLSYYAETGVDNVKAYLKLRGTNTDESRIVSQGGYLTIDGAPLKIEPKSYFDDEVSITTTNLRYKFLNDSFSLYNKSGFNNFRISLDNSTETPMITLSNPNKNLFIKYKGSDLNISSNINSTVSTKLHTYLKDINISDTLIIGSTSNNFSYSTNHLVGYKDNIKQFTLDFDTVNRGITTYNNRSVRVNYNTSDGNWCSNLSYNKLEFISSDNNTESSIVMNGYVIKKEIKDTTNTLKMLGNLNVRNDITADRVFNAVYNDYAELYEKDNSDEIINPGDVIELNPCTGKYRKSTSKYSKYVVGVYSDTYGHLLGGDKGKTEKQNLKKYIPVGISGRVYVKVYNDDIEPGDLLVSAENGYALKGYCNTSGCVIGKALSYIENGKVLMQIMLG